MTASPLSPQARALLNGPDRRSTWVIIVAATLRDRVRDLDQRLADVAAAVPVVRARLRGGAWQPGTPPRVQTVSGEPLGTPSLTLPFALADEPPVRVLAEAGGLRLAVAAHHAAFDGLGIVAVLAALLGGPLPAPPAAAPPGHGGYWPLLRRLAQPASPVAASPARPARETLLVRPVELAGPGVTARIAAAAVAAAGRHNARLGRPWARIGVSLGVGGPQGAGYVSTYRRVDLSPGAPVAPAVSAALAKPYEPPGAGEAGWLLAPLAYRFSDSLLISNVGRHALPAAERLDLFPVARGRSAVAFGAAGLSGGTSTLSLRARDLAADDAARLLDDVVARL